MSRIPTDRASTIVAAVLVCVGYFIGARVGFAFTIHPSPVSTLWPPNSILLAARIHGAYLETLTNTGHGFFWEAPWDVVTLLHTFFHAI